MKIQKLAIGAGMLAFVAATNVLAQEGVSVEKIDAATQASLDRMTTSYWTAERMASARPMPVPTVRVDSLAAPQASQAIDSSAVPGSIAGCRPGAADCSPVAKSLAPEAIPSESAAPGDLLQPMHGTKPANPRTGPYGPFQRWREANPITAYPKSTVGKFFFTLNGSNFVCSASVIGRSTIATAGHCISDGAGHFATNRLFCPSYNGAQDPTRGCWAANTSATTSTRWHTLKDPDFDYACLVTAATGQKVANKIGNVTGWLGRAWNWSSNQAERTFGYPQAAPFNGGTLQTTASTEWYTHDFQAGLQVSKIIGSDLTGGSSGGPWILGWTGGLAETVDTDASAVTDPGSNWINGVNSHKRCVVNCSSPPTTTSGVFWQEMTSPPFMKTTAGGESEDVFAICLGHSNNL